MTNSTSSKTHVHVDPSCKRHAPQTPGNVKSGKLGQFPSFAGSPPIRTHAECDGVGPSRMNSWCQLGGETFAFGGAVMVHVVPAQVNAGKRIRPPLMTLPCVLDDAASESSDRQWNSCARKTYLRGEKCASCRWFPGKGSRRCYIVRQTPSPSA